MSEFESAKARGGRKAKTDELEAARRGRREGEKRRRVEVCRGVDDGEREVDWPGGRYLKGDLSLSSCCLLVSRCRFSFFLDLAFARQRMDLWFCGRGTSCVMG